MAPKRHATKSLRTAIADTVVPHSKKRFLAVVFATAGKGQDPDPHIQQLVRTATMMNRIIAKHLEFEATMRLIVEKYAAKGMWGTNQKGGFSSRGTFRPPSMKGLTFANLKR
jgi:hypothetical protein